MGNVLSRRRTTQPITTTSSASSENQLIPLHQRLKSLKDQLSRFEPTVGASWDALFRESQALYEECSRLLSSTSWNTPSKEREAIASLREETGRLDEELRLFSDRAAGLTPEKILALRVLIDTELRDIDALIAALEQQIECSKKPGASAKSSNLVALVRKFGSSVRRVGIFLGKNARLEASLVTSIATGNVIGAVIDGIELAASAYSNVRGRSSATTTAADKDASKDTLPKEAPKDASKDAAKDSSKDGPQDATKDTPKVTSKDVSNDAVARTSECYTEQKATTTSQSICSTGVLKEVKPLELRAFDDAKSHSEGPLKHRRWTTSEPVSVPEEQFQKAEPSSDLKAESVAARKVQRHALAGAERAKDAKAEVLSERRQEATSEADQMEAQREAPPTKKQSKDSLETAAQTPEDTHVGGADEESGSEQMLRREQTGKTTAPTNAKARTRH